MKAAVWCVEILLLMGATSAAQETVASTTPLGWRDSWDGVHSLTIFYPDHAIDPAVVTPLAKHFDFGWSSGPYLSAMRAGNPEFVSGIYASSTQFPNNLAWYKTNHPDWILYENDRVTPCLQYAYEAVMLDITNPEVVDFKFNEFSWQGDRPKGCVAWDNFSLDNDYPRPNGSWGSCAGIYDKNGNWVQKFAGRGSYAEVLDPAYTDAMIQYARVVRDRLHALPYPVLLIPNTDPKIISGDPVRSANFIAAVDGILWEVGNYGPHWVGDSRMIWLRNQRFTEAMQAAGKACYVNETLWTWTGETLTKEYIQFTLASYLLSKGHVAALRMPDAASGWYDSELDWYPELEAADRIGTPSGAMVQAAGTSGTEDGVYLREYSGGVCLVNASTTRRFTVSLPAGNSYKDLYGNPVVSPVSMAPDSGMVLLKNPPANRPRSDFNGDRKADLLFRHPSGGQVLLWIMN